MPGLAVIIDPAAGPRSESDLQSMVAAMSHEPFYQSGTYCCGAQGVYVGWACPPVAVRKCLPLRAENGRFLLFLYGEHHGEGDGEQVCDASEILNLFHEHGVEAVSRLNGWFQGVFIDRMERTVSVFNDRYGMQRLHLSADGNRMIFSAEAKALLRVLPERRAFHAPSVAEFLTCGCVLENRSLFRNVHVLPAASVWTFAADAPRRERRYFFPNEWENQPPLPRTGFEELLQVTLRRAVLRCLGPEGTSAALSLTGGYDTRLIAACLRSESRPVPCYTFGGMHRECFDVKIARKVARACEFDHRVFALDGGFLSRFPDLAARTVALSDGCLGASNAYELHFNQLAREIAPVRLTGNFGSEVMRGLRAFKAVAPTPGLVHQDFQPHITEALNSFAAIDGGNPLTFSLFTQAPLYYYHRLAVEQSQVVVRTPFMDHDFVRLFYRRPPGLGDGRDLAQHVISGAVPELAPLPTDTGNCSIWRQRWSELLFKADYCYKSGMPQWLERLHYWSGPLAPERFLIGHHRFAHPRAWWRSHLAEYLRQMLLDSRTLNRPFFSRRFVTHMLESHLKGNRNYTDDIERVLTVELAARQLLEN